MSDTSRDHDMAGSAPDADGSGTPIRSAAPPSAVVRRIARRRGAYGVDAPYVPVVLGAIAVTFLAAAAVSAGPLGIPLLAAICAAYGIFFLLSTASYLYTTRAGKFRVWAEQLARLGLRGDEQVVDLGCGRGAVLLMAAQLLPQGKAVGVDLWKSSDQSGNDPAVTRRNAEREGVSEQVELQTADLRALPLAEATFDLVLSSLAIHNIVDAAGRAQAIDEAVRILKPGGRLVIADIRATPQYAERLHQRSMIHVQRHRLGWRYWYGGPWGAATLVSATKPA
jgi:arsenite methyltransferase